MLGITWRDRVPHTEILRRAGCRSIEATITHYQLRWLGHVIRMPLNRLPHKVLYGQLAQGQRSAGGQKKRYKDQIKTALKKCKIRPGDLEGLAADRKTWRQMCQDGTKALEEDRTARRQERQERRHTRKTTKVASTTTTTFACPTCECGMWIQDRTIQPSEHSQLSRAHV